MLADHHRTRGRKHACGLLWSLCIDDTTRIQSRRFLSIIDILTSLKMTYSILYTCVFTHVGLSVYVCVHVNTLLCEMPAEGISSFGTGVTGS